MEGEKSKQKEELGNSNSNSTIAKKLKWGNGIQSAIENQKTLVRIWTLVKKLQKRAEKTNR